MINNKCLKESNIIVTSISGHTSPKLNKYHRTHRNFVNTTTLNLTTTTNIQTRMNLVSPNKWRQKSNKALHHPISLGVFLIWEIPATWTVCSSASTNPNTLSTNLLRLWILQAAKRADNSAIIFWILWRRWTIAILHFHYRSKKSKN